MEDLKSSIRPCSCNGRCFPGSSSIGGLYIYILSAMPQPSSNSPSYSDLLWGCHDSAGAPEFILRCGIQLAKHFSFCSFDEGKSKFLALMGQKDACGISEAKAMAKSDLQLLAGPAEPLTAGRSQINETNYSLQNRSQLDPSPRSFSKTHH